MAALQLQNGFTSVRLQLIAEDEQGGEIKVLLKLVPGMPHYRLCPHLAQ